MHGHELLHGAAALVLVVAGAYFVPASWAARRRHSSRAELGRTARGSAGSAAFIRLWAVVAITLALSAAVIHLAVTGEHFVQSELLGMAFAVTAAIQVGLAVGLVVSFEQARLPAAVFSLAVAAVWLMSRTTGLPLGPHPWIAEPVGVADLTATMFEVGLAAMLLVPMRNLQAVRDRAAIERFSIATVPIVGALAIVMLIAIASLQSAAPHAH